MGFKFDTQLTVPEILKGPEKVIVENFDLLEDDYKEKFGKDVKNKSCAPCIREVVSALKIYYNMSGSKFRFRGNSIRFINNKGETEKITNNTLTDEKAIEVLQKNPQAISLFSSYPENWQSLLKGKVEYSEGEKEKMAELSEYSLKELRELYPDIEAKSKKAFIRNVMET